jgi:NADH:ubiquinone oxidoreductase subunit 5 (subunit L)/multisubunit Na+/H+ antiporter MnhA subunit
VVGVTFTVGAAALAGLPPLSIWWAKDAVLAGVPLGSPDLQGAGLLTVAGLLATALSAVAATRAAWFVWRPTRSPSIRRGADRRRRVSVAVSAALVVLAVPAAAVGGVGVWVGLVPRADAGELVTTGVVVVFAAAATWALHTRPIRLRSTVLPRLAAAARGWLGLEAATRAVVVRPVLALARALDRADGALGTALPRAAATVPGLARGLDERGERPLASAVAGLAGAVRRLGDVARRPQTGQQHQYYAQGVVVLGTLGVLVGVLVVAGVR